MGNCCSCKRRPKRKIVLLLVGLDNAGKTVAVKGLAGEKTENSIPTVGFSIVNLKYLNYNVCIYDLGGGSNIRGIWHRYFVDAHGVIFVVDASDFNRFDEAKIVLEELLSHEKISGKPLLVLANKQDHKEALDEIDIVEKLDLEKLVNEKKCPTLVETCSAKEASQKVDPSIEKGYHWLLNFILKEYECLNRRVESDVQKQKEIEEKARKEKIERLKNDSTKETVEVIKLNGQMNNEFVKSPTPSAKSVNSLVSNKVSDLKQTEVNRPKSAVQIVRNHLEKSNSSCSKTKAYQITPATLLSPKSAPPIKSTREIDENFRCSTQTGQILTVTELPNAIIDANGENIGDLFELNNFSRKLPPLRQKPTDGFSWSTKSAGNKVGVLENNIDDIYKDIS